MSGPLVMRVSEAEGRRLYESLGRGSFLFRPVPHTVWSARGEEVTATLYRSGKLVVQGKGVEAFRLRYLPDTPAAPQPSTPSVLPLGGPEVGSDESGKGDYFGPLVVAAAAVRPEDVPRLEAMGVRDSKLASDGQIRRVEGVLAQALPHAVRVLEPEAYNTAYREVGNLNVLLGRLHAQVIDEVLGVLPGEAVRIVVDRFGDPDHVRRHLSDRARRQPFVMPTQGERHVAVAAASFLARAAFLRSFDELRALAGDELYPGASDPRIVPLARRLLREGGEAWLGRFAKLHFKVTQKAR